MSFSRIILHAGAASIIFYGYNGLKQLEVYPEMTAQYGGFWQYLTIQGIYLSGLTMVVSLMLDVFPMFGSLRPLKRLLLMFTLPLNVVISSIYWSLVLFLPAMILQKTKALSDDSPSYHAMIEMLFYIPLDMDLALHAVPAIALTLDFFLFERRYSHKAINVLAPLLAFAYTVWYGWWVERCGARNNGMFPYPFLTNNPFHTRLAIYAGAGLIAPLSFRLLNRMHT
ncbi:hypothetical protein AN958_11287 [Leucoagaricus sp. SymC.cos]|nr:hypothetical protein AN958_11287 [Leucoagaricus sp. SymC.cos]